MAATVDGEDRVLATAQQIVNSLNTSKDVTDDMLLILSTFDNRLSNLSLSQSQSHHFAAAEDLILRRSAASDPLDADYLAAVDDVLDLSADADLSDRAAAAVQLAMAWLEDDFRLVLARNAPPLDAERLYGSIRRVSLSFTSRDPEMLGDFESPVAAADEDNANDGKCFHERGASLGENAFVDLVNLESVAELREIAERMGRAGYEKECCRVYSAVRREVLEEWLWSSQDKVQLIA